MLPAGLYDSFEEFLLTPKMLDFGPLGMSGGIRRIEPAMHAPAVPHGKRFDPGRASGAPRSARSSCPCLLHPKRSHWCNDGNRGACTWNSDFNRSRVQSKKLLDRPPAVSEFALGINSGPRGLTHRPLPFEV